MKIRENGGVAERAPGRGIERSGHRNKREMEREREDERTESKTVGAAFFCGRGIQKLIQKAVYKHLTVCQSYNTKPKKNSRGVDLISPPWQPSSEHSQGFL